MGRRQYRSHFWYNCIIGKTGSTQLGAACSIAHLKLKYHADDNTITTLHGDIKAARICFLQANKNQNSVSLSELSFKDKGETAASLHDSNLISILASPSLSGKS
jgi:hypothetical protein